MEILFYSADMGTVSFSIRMEWNFYPTLQIWEHLYFLEEWNGTSILLCRYGNISILQKNGMEFLSYSADMGTVSFSCRRGRSCITRRGS